MYKYLPKTVLICAVLCLIFSSIALGRAEQEFKSEKSKQALSAEAQAYCVVTHDVGKMHLSISNYGFFGSGFAFNPLDCFTGQFTPSCEFPAGSNNEYLYGAAIWVGAVVNGDTLVSIGFDGWQICREMYPDVPPKGNIIERSILNPATPDAISEQDYIAVYTDTFTSGYTDLCDDYIDGRPHIPLNIEITQSSYAWSYAFAEDFVIFDYRIKNIGENTLNDVYMGIYVDADITNRTDPFGYEDDITGFIRTLPIQYGACEFEEDINMPWVADNDGELDQVQYAPVPNVTGTKILFAPSDSLTINYNWWVSNGTGALDFGPRLIGTPEDPFRDYTTGGIGTPEGDRNKYYIMRHRETDYDQIYGNMISVISDPIWVPTPTALQNLVRGFDTRYLLSFGPFTLTPGQTLPIVFAYVGGEYFHVDPDNYTNNLVNNYEPMLYNDNLNYLDLIYNSQWASWIFDNPGVDTDSDGYLGEYRICCDQQSGECDTFWVSGDGIPDFRGAGPPTAPKMWVTAVDGLIKLRWNGLKSETSRDVFSGREDFEGYNVYLASDLQPSSFAVIASYDIEDYVKFTFNQGMNEWEVRDYPFSVSELRCLYGSGGDPCNDTGFNPLDYPESNPFVESPDSIFYFEKVALNTQLGVTTPIVKRFPDAPYPSTLNPPQAQPEELTEDGYLKYFEYELIIENLLPGEEYCANVTAFDYGDFMSGVPSMETPVLQGAQCVTLPFVEEVIPTNEWISVYCEDAMWELYHFVEGDVIRAYDPDGVLCGMDTVGPGSTYGFMPIYRDDIYSDIDEGAEPGDTIVFTVNGADALTDPVIVWTVNGDRFELCHFFMSCFDLELKEGWNLISWNVTYEDEIEDFIGRLEGCVDMVLGFDGGGLTYDPNLSQFSTLHDVDYYHGYWLKMNCPVTLEMCDAPINYMDESYISLDKGWNLISYWPSFDRTTDDVMSFLYGNDILLKVLGYEDSLQVYKPNWSFSTLDQMEVGLGYWVEVSDDGVLEYFPIFADRASKDKPIQRAESVTQADDIVTAPNWVNLYSSALKIDGQLAPAGTELAAYNGEGVKVGRYVLTEEGKFGFMPVYGDGEILKTGDEFYLSVDGRETRERFLWSANGTQIEVKVLTYAAGPGELPEEYSLSQNYPNPFNPVTNIKFTLPEAADVTLEVFNTLGRKVATLVDARLDCGEHIISWNSRDYNSRSVASGIYLYRLTAGSFTETRKMILLK